MSLTIARDLLRLTQSPMAPLLRPNSAAYLTVYYLLAMYELWLCYGCIIQSMRSLIQYCIIKGSTACSPMSQSDSISSSLRRRIYDIVA